MDGYREKYGVATPPAGDMAEGVIYAIRCSAGSRIYVGQTRHINARRRDHFAKLRRGVHANRYLQNAFFKYGPEEFNFCVLEKVAAALLDARERHWIAFFNSTDPKCGFNMEAGGRSGGTPSLNARANMSAAQKKRFSSPGAIKKLSEDLRRPRRHLSDEHKKKISEVHSVLKLGSLHAARLQAGLKKAWLDPDKRKRMLSGIVGRIHTPEEIERSAAARRGVKMSESARAKMSGSHIGLRQSAETKAKRKATWAAKRGAA